MDPTPSELIGWLIIGALAGSVAGLVVTRKKEGFGRYTNLAIGLIGAFFGGGIFHVLDRLLDIKLELGELTLRYDDLLAALIGSLIFLAAIWWVRRWRRKRKSAAT